MRISDWSSDVCSSDLAGPAAVVRCTAVRSVRCDCTERPVQSAALSVFGAAPPPRCAADAEIGIASCRERECQYLSISVVAVSFIIKIYSTSHPSANDHRKLTYLGFSYLLFEYY